MPRKSKNILETLTILPWWCSVVAALFVYVVLSYILPAVAGENMFAAGFAKVLAQFAPYIFFLFLLPVPFSLLNFRHKRKQLDAQKGIDSIRELSWQQFEELVGEAYRRQGYRVVENDGAGPDGGVDLVLYKDGSRYLVQCKQWRTQKIGVKIVREMFGLVSAENAAGGIVITSGSFTRDALNFAGGKALELVNGEQLAELVKSVQRNPRVCSVPQEKSKPQQKTSIIPLCPTCGSTMVLRTARRGKTVGQQFWGCKNYPRCRGTRDFYG